MPPKAVSTTARDLELLVLAWQSLKTAPQVDYELFAQKAGYKNAATAATQFNTLKKKVFALAVAADGTAVSVPATPRRKRGPAGAAEGTPSKKARVKKEEQEAVKMAGGEDGNDDDAGNDDEDGEGSVHGAGQDAEV